MSIIKEQVQEETREILQSQKDTTISNIIPKQNSIRTKHIPLYIEEK